MSTAPFKPTLADIEAAADRIAGHIVATPLFENDALNALTGARILLKAEVLQHTGSFKFRGAYNRVSQFTPEQKKAGIVAWSSGNHALAVSAVAAKLGVQATILMPSDAPRAKVEGARALGGNVRLYDRKTESREAIGAEIAGRTGAVIVPPYDDPYVITGQGTVGLEMVRQARAQGLELDAVLGNCSGGGLISGIASAVKALSPATAVYAVEPAEFDDTARSLAAGERLKNPAGRESICDALQVAIPGEITFPIMQQTLAGGLAVTDDEVRDAIRFGYKALKLVLEPGGAAALAAVLSGKLDVAGKTVGVVLSGGNVDPENYAAWIAA